MSTRSFLLLIVSVVAIFIFFNIPNYNKWFKDRVIYSIDNFDEEKDHMSIEDRKNYKYRDTYSVLHQAAEYFKKNHIKNPIVLLPPNGYLKAQHVNFGVPEPIIVYYYTGLNSVWIDSPNVDSANWTFTFQNGKMNIIQIQNKEQLHSLLSLYKNYSPIL